MGIERELNAHIGNRSPIVAKLKEAGLIPAETVSIDIYIAVNEVVTITTKSFASHEQIAAIEKALLEHHESKATIARILQLTTYDRTMEATVTI